MPSHCHVIINTHKYSLSLYFFINKYCLVDNFHLIIYFRCLSRNEKHPWSMRGNASNRNNNMNQVANTIYKPSLLSLLSLFCSCSSFTSFLLPFLFNSSPVSTTHLPLSFSLLSLKLFTATDCCGVALTEPMQQYFCINNTSLLYCTTIVDCSDPDEVHHPSCDNILPHGNSYRSQQCKKMLKHLRTQLGRFQASVKNGTLLERAANDMIPTPGALQELYKQINTLQQQHTQLQATLSSSFIPNPDDWRHPLAQHYLTFLNTQTKSTFLLEFIDCQATQACASGAKQRRWPPTILRFAKLIRHQTSGRKVIGLLTGAGNFGKKKNNNSNDNFNLHIPSNRTLDIYEESGYYPMPPPTELARIRESALTYARGANNCWFIICYDGAHVIPGFEYDVHLNLVLGGEKAYTPEEFLNQLDEETVLQEANEVVQFYLQSIDGGYVEPVGHFAQPTGVSTAWILHILKYIVC